jgi:hypothetical protein
MSLAGFSNTLSCAQECTYEVVECREIPAAALAKAVEEHWR